MKTYVFVLGGFACLFAEFRGRFQQYLLTAPLSSVPQPPTQTLATISRKGVNCLLILPPRSLTMLKSSGACHRLKFLFSKWWPITFLHPFRRWFEFILLKLHPH